MPRSLWKVPFISRQLLNISKEMKTSKVWTRSSTIYPRLVGYTLLVHRGNLFKRLFITEEMVGHKLGEFVFTRKRHVFVKKKKKKK